MTLGEAADITPEGSRSAGGLAVFTGGGLITIGNTPSVLGRMVPGTRLWMPLVMPEKSWPFVYVDINGATVPVKIAP